MRNKSEIKGRVPKLRFPEFREMGEWQVESIRRVFNLEDQAEKCIDFKKDKIITVKLHCQGVIKNERTDSLTGGTNYLKRKSGQFIFSKIDLLNGAFGIVPDNLDGFYSSTDIPAYTFIGSHNPLFFLKWLSVNYNKLAIERTGTSTTLKRVSKDAFMDLEFLIPSLPEQQKIADCLFSLDELIVAHNKKLDTFKFHKKGLLQQLFPAEGETGPRLRFLEFRDAGEWEEKKLQNVCKMQAGKFISATEINDKQSSGLFPCYGGNGQRGYTKTFNHNGKYPLIGRQGALCGNITFAEGKFYATEHAVVCTPQAKVIVTWLYFQLARMNLNQYATGQAQPGLSVDVLEKLPVKAPISELEQQKIADCLSSLDDLIFAQTRKIEALKTHKKGLMQQLFPEAMETV